MDRVQPRCKCAYCRNPFWEPAPKKLGKYTIHFWVEWLEHNSRWLELHQNHPAYAARKATLGKIAAEVERAARSDAAQRVRYSYQAEFWAEEATA